MIPAGVNVARVVIAVLIDGCASFTLALCKHCQYHGRMRTLYLRNVPDEVVDRLEKLARDSKMSVTAVAVRELDAATRRVDNAALVATLPDLRVPTASIVRSVHADRT